MKFLMFSIGLLLAAIAVMFVPVSFAVDGFGLVVNPGGVRTVRAAEAGTVLHFPPQDGRFHPGQIVTAVTRADAEATNRHLLGTLRRELSKAEADFLSERTKIVADLERAKAKRDATIEQLQARAQLIKNRTDLLAALRDYNAQRNTDIETLNEERLEQLARLEELVMRAGEVAAIPSQQLAKVMGEIQSGRVSVITSTDTQFSTGRLVLDMQKELNDLNYANTIDEAEVSVLSDQVNDFAAQLDELERLRASTRAEAEARYLAKLAWPELAIAGGRAVDIRYLQPNRASVARNDPLRLIEEKGASAGLAFLIHGRPDTGRVLINTGAQDITIALPPREDDIAAALRAGGLEVAAVHVDTATVGAASVTSVFAEFAGRPAERPTILSAEARSGEGVPVSVVAELAGFETALATAGDDGAAEIIGFLENRYAVVLEPGQKVRGLINDLQGGTTQIQFDAKLLNRDFSTVDTAELGIRVGNRSLATKIIKRGVLSQVVVGVDAESAALLDRVPGAIVQLNFPLARQTLFDFLLARNVAL